MKRATDTYSRLSYPISMDTLLITSADEGIRLDQLLVKHFPPHSRTYFQYLIKEQSITLNDSPIKKMTKPRCGDQVKIFYLHPPETPVKPENIPLNILYEDNAILVINKSAGMVTHPAPGNRSGTLVNALLYYVKNLKNWDDTLRPGIVHRLDKDTSGILIAAKTIEAYRKLIKQFSERTINKTYLAITLGNPKNCIITLPIGRHPKKRKEMTTLQEGGKEAISEIESIATSNHLSYVKVKPKTGRTHQIRVHLKSCNAAILGDSVYGNKNINHKYRVLRQLLHASTITFFHPLTNEKIHLVAPIPQDLQKWIDQISAK